MEDFEHSLNSILTNSVKTPKLGASLDEAYAIPSSVSSSFLCSFKSVSDTSRPQLAPSIKSHEIWCQAGALLCLFYR